MHENEIIAIHYILDMICADDYLKFYVEQRLKRMNSRYWDTHDLLRTVIKIRSQISEIDRLEVDIPIMQNLKIRVEK